MTPLQRYVAEEIAIDHADGLLSRREALRRLGLLGPRPPGGDALLAAVPPTTRPRPPPSSSGDPSDAGRTPAPGPALATEADHVRRPAGRTLMGAWAAAATPRGAVLVIHENRGLTDHIRSVAGRFAASGYSALAIDLLSAEGGTASFGDSAAGHRRPDRPRRRTRLVADLRAGARRTRAGGLRARSWRRSGSASAAAWCGPCSPPASPGSRRRCRSTVRLPADADFAGSKRRGARHLRRAGRAGQRLPRRGRRRAAGRPG